MSGPIKGSLGLLHALTHYGESGGLPSEVAGFSQGQKHT
jgi:hypothetical protein